MLRVIGINAALLAVVLLAAELVFGTWLFGPSYGSLNLPRNLTRVYEVGDPAKATRTVVYTRDRHGLRGKYDSPATIGVLALGGSTTNEVYVSDGETWTDRLAEHFARAGVPLNVVNAGAEGQTTVGHLRNFDAWFPLIPDLKARYVLAYVGINDMALGPDGTHADQSRYDRAQSPSMARRIKSYIRNNSVLYRLWRMGRGMRKAKDARLVHATVVHADATWLPVSVAIAPPPPDGTLGRQVAAYQSRVAALIRRIRATGAEAVIVTQQRSNWRRENGVVLFAAGKDGDPDIGSYAEMTLFNRAAMAACAEAGATCIDLANEIEFRPGDFYDWVHTTPAGSARIAEYLFGKLKDRVR